MQPTGSARIERRLVAILAADGLLLGTGVGAVRVQAQKAAKQHQIAIVAPAGPVASVSTEPNPAISRFTGRADSSS